jgi:hypothetical protein
MHIYTGTHYAALGATMTSHSRISLHMLARTSRDDHDDRNDFFIRGDEAALPNVRRDRRGRRVYDRLSVYNNPEMTDANAFLGRYFVSFFSF